MNKSPPVPQIDLGRKGVSCSNPLVTINEFDKYLTNIVMVVLLYQLVSSARHKIQIREWGPSTSGYPENLQCSTLGSDLQSTTAKESILSGGEDCSWSYDQTQLTIDLVSGNVSLNNRNLQRKLVDWMSACDYNHFRNLETGENVYALQSKRGNVVHAARKSKQRDETCELLDGQEFDYPMKVIMDIDQ